MVAHRREQSNFCIARVAVLISYGWMPAPKTILVVDDDPAIRDLLGAVLASPGLRIDNAADGLQALSRLRENPYDLVITDIRMPRLDGLELLGRIRQVRPETRIVVMTAENTPANIIRSIREQAFGYFSKPFSANAVAEMVKQALSSTAFGGDIEVLSARPEWITLQVRCKIEAADRLVQFLKEMQVELPVREQENIAAAFRELLMNAIEHGAHNDPEKKLRVACVRTSRMILYYVQDPGEGFSFDELAHAAVANRPDAPLAHLEVRSQRGIRPGGFGILLTRNLADELMYNEKGNEVLLIKYLDR
jgi:CheY-like chemotaxis protein/anti-sigma regulatory factor (Ser/Thr protein kinase)